MNTQLLRILVLEKNSTESKRLMQNFEHSDYEAIFIDHIDKIKRINEGVDIVIVSEFFRKNLKNVKLLIPDTLIAYASDNIQSLNGQATYVDYPIAYPYDLGQVKMLCEHVSTDSALKNYQGIADRLAEMVLNPNRADSLAHLAQWIVEQVPTYQTASVHLIKRGVFQCRTIASRSGQTWDRPTLQVGLQEGIFRAICEDRQIHAIPDRSKQLDFIPCSLHQISFRSLISIPILIRQDVIGVLTCYAQNPLHFSKRHELKLQTLANVAALEAYNEWQVEERKLLNEVNQAWQYAESRTAALDIIINNIDAIADSQGAAVCLYSTDSRRYLNKRYKRESGLGINIIDWTQQTDEWEEFHEYVFERGYLLVEDVQKRNTKFLQIQIDFIAHGIHAFIALPLKHNGLSMGMLFVFYNWQHPYTLGNREYSEYRDSLDIFHQQASHAIGRAYEQERYRWNVRTLQHWTTATHNGLPLTDASPQFWQQFIKHTILNEDIAAERAAIIIFDGFLTNIHQVNMNSRYIQAQLTLAGSLETHVCHYKQSILAANIIVEKRERTTYQIRDLGGASDAIWDIAIDDISKLPKSKLIVPTVHQGQLLGLLILESSQHSLNRFDKEHFEYLARAIGLTLSNASTPVSRLINEAEQLPTLEPIRQDIEKIANRLRTNLSADLVSILLYSPYWDSFQIPITSGKMDAVVLPYSADQVRQLMKRNSTAILNNTTILHALTPELWKREQFQSACAICFYNEDSLPIGAILIHWRKVRMLTDNDVRRIGAASAGIGRMVIRNYTFTQAATILQTHLKFDLVRLHFVKQTVKSANLHNHTQLRWASKPVTKGNLLIEYEWSQRKATGPITAAINQYITTGVPYTFYDNATKTSSFAQREKIQSGARIVLVINQGQSTEEIMGVLFVNWRTYHQWTQAEKTAVLSYARHMALAIHNRQIINALKEHSISENWIQELFSIIIRNNLSREEALNRILETACSITGAHFGDIRLKKNNNLVAEAVQGDSKIANKYKTVYRELPIAGKGLTCQAFRTGKAEIFPYVFAEENYIQADKTTSSEMVAVIRQVDSGEKIGTITLGSRLIEGFDHHDRQHLISIAEVTAIILQSIEHFNTLHQDQQLLFLFEQVVFDSIISKNWQHSARQTDFAIRTNVAAISDLLNKKRTPKNQIRQSLKRIEQLVNEFSQIPINRGLSREFSSGIVEPIELDNTLKSYVEELCVEHNTTLYMDLNCSIAKIAIGDSAFKVVIEKLIQNALDALASKGKEGQIVIHTSIQNPYAEVIIEDNGPGISAEILRYYLRKPIPPHLRKGLGTGAILALLFLHNYKGKLEYIHCEDKVGATHRILIPLANGSKEATP